MEQIKKFLHGKGFALVLAACLLAAAAAGVWAVRTVRDELRQNLTDLTNPSSTARHGLRYPGYAVGGLLGRIGKVQP